MAKNYSSMRNSGPTGNKVIVDGDVNKALRKFKKKVEESGVLEVVREKMFYEKPTTERKRKAGAAKARWLKKQKNDQLPPKLY
jgi:small subunit ribosomal protein S21